MASSRSGIPFLNSKITEWQDIKATAARYPKVKQRIDNIQFISFCFMFSFGNHFITTDQIVIMIPKCSYIINKMLRVT